MEAEANNILSSLLSLGIWLGVIGVAVGAVLIPMIFRKVVEPNEVHIVQSRGQTMSYGKEKAGGNAYYAWPAWVPVFGRQIVVLPLAIFDLELRDYEAYDIGKVPFVVDIWSFFRIGDSNMAAERVQTFVELKAQISAILQGATRTILAKSEIEEIMEERSIYGQRFTEEVEKHLKAWGVETVKTIELMDIRDPVDGSSKTIADIMARKKSLIDRESRVVVAENQKAAEIAEVDAFRDVDLQKQEARQLVGERTAAANQQIGVANEKSQQEIKEEARLTMTKDKAVLQVEQVREAEIAREVVVVQADQDKQQLIIASEGERERDIITATGEKQQMVLKAEGFKESESLRSQAIAAVGGKEAEVIQKKEVAGVQGQITLAEVIGENDGYQTYLVKIRDMERAEAVGVANAAALENADVRVIANGGDAPAGLENVGELFSTAGGMKLSSMIEGLAATPTGEQVLKALKVTRPNGEVDNRDAA